MVDEENEQNNNEILNRNLNKALSTCAGKSFFYREFSKMYSFTTENISGYIDYFDLNNKSLLTVGSSGDQILNAYYNGARDITLFDINENAKYYVYLKIAAIMSLSYKEFKTFFFKYSISPLVPNDNMFSKKIFDKLKNNLRALNYESYIFFDKLFSLYNGYIIRDRLFYDDEDRKTIIKGFNKYLKNEDSYNRLKIIINDIGFKYICGNIFYDDINGKFDNIFLSNICSTTNLIRFKRLIETIDKNNLKNNGSMLLGYIWNMSIDREKYEDIYKDIYKMPIVREVLKDYITEAYDVNGPKDILWKGNKKRDLVLIYRKNN